MKAKTVIVAVLMAAASIGTLSSTTTMTVYAQADFCPATIEDLIQGKCSPIDDDTAICIFDPGSGECSPIEGFRGIDEDLLRSEIEEGQTCVCLDKFDLRVLLPFIEQPLAVYTND